jgi:hypothetical protein
MVVGVDLDTVTEIRSARELGGWQPGDAWLAGRTYLFSEPQRHLTRLLDLSDMGWAPVQFTDRGAGGHAILIAPDGDDLPRAFKGNLCGCTGGYRAIEDAVRGGGQRDRFGYSRSPIDGRRHALLPGRGPVRVALPGPERGRAHSGVGSHPDLPATSPPWWRSLPIGDSGDPAMIRRARCPHAGPCAATGVRRPPVRRRARAHRR